MKAKTRREFLKEAPIFAGGSIIGLSAFMQACALNRQIQYPSTPKGQATLLIGSLHDQVDIYLQEVSWAEDPGHIDMLNNRLNAIKLTTGNMKEIASVVSAGGSIPEGLLQSTKANLTELKRWLYTRQEFEPSQASVRAALVKAHLISDNQAQGWESVVLLLIEVIQAFAPMMDRLVSMGGMTPEQLQAEFDYQNGWLQTFDPYKLPVAG